MNHLLCVGMALSLRIWYANLYMYVCMRKAHRQFQKKKQNGVHGTFADPTHPAMYPMQGRRQLHVLQMNK